MATPDSPLIGKPSGTLAQAIAWAGQENAEYIRELWRLCELVGLDAGILFAQWAHETADGNSPRWVNNRNPAGLGIEADSDKDPATLTQTEAARLHVWSLYYISTSGVLWEPSWALPDLAHRFRRRWVRKYADHKHPGPVHSLAELQSRYVDSSGEPQAVWAWDDRYAAKLIAKHRAIFGTDAATTVQSEGANAQMSTYTTVIPGLPGGPLVTDYPIKMKIVPASQTINRPGIKASLPRVSVQHGNGNPSAYAAADAQWLYNGARDSNGNPQRVSFHFTGDDMEVWVCIPVDEVTWQAADGGGPGNMNGLSYELSEHQEIRSSPSRRKRATHIAADLMGKCAARLNIAEPQQHWDFNAALPPSQRHDCPNMLRHNAIDGKPAWDYYFNVWQAAKAKELGAQTPQPSPIWWEPGDDWGPQTRTHDGAIAWAFLGEVRAKRDVPLRKDAHTKAEVVHRLKAGDAVQIVGTYKAANKVVWAMLEYAPGKVGRAPLSAFNPYRWPTV